MDLMLFVKSLFLGLAVTAPLGPIGALCINRILEQGFVAGMARGLGTALADGVYAAFAALGFAAFSSVLGLNDIPLRLVGGAFMLWLGWKSMTPRPVCTAAQVSARDLIGTTAATFLLTITNPMTNSLFCSAFCWSWSVWPPVLAQQVPLSLFSAFLQGRWCILSGGVALARHRLPEAFASWATHLSGIVLIVFGLRALASAVS